MGQSVSNDSCFWSSPRTSSQSLPVYNDCSYDVVNSQNKWSWRTGREQARRPHTLQETRTAEGRNEYSAFAYYSSRPMGTAI